MLELISSSVMIAQLKGFTSMFDCSDRSYDAEGSYQSKVFKVFPMDFVGNPNAKGIQRKH
jgi:hypothetical protein